MSKKLKAPTEKVVGMQPTENRLIVQQLDAAEKIGTIIIPDEAKEKPKVGKVLAAGPDVKSVEVGDWIAFEPYAGTKVEVFGKTVLVMQEELVLLVIILESQDPRKATPAKGKKQPMGAK